MSSSTKVGRNDPCPCGSGKKYKKCCLDKDEAAAREQRAAAQAPPADAEPPGQSPATAAPGPDYNPTPDQLNKLYEWVFFGENRAHIRRAQEYFSEPYLTGKSPVPEGAQGIVAAWTAFGYRTIRGRTLADMYLARFANRLSAADREFLMIRMAEPFRMLEVTRIGPGDQLTVRDLFSHKEFVVREPAPGKKMRRWDYVLAHLGPHGDYATFDAALVVFRPTSDIALSRLDDILFEMQTQNPRAGHADVLRERLPEIIEIALESRTETYVSAAHRLTNRDLEWSDFVCGASYRLLNAHVTRNALDAHRRFEQISFDLYHWYARQRRRRRERLRQPRFLGQIAICEGMLYLEADSPQLLARGKAMLNRAVGPHVRHLRDSFANRESKRGQISSVEQDGDEIAATMHDYFRKWLDLALPELDRRTPRQAAADPVRRPILIEIVKNMENERPAPGALEFDFTEIKRELKLTEIL